MDKEGVEERVWKRERGEGRGRERRREELYSSNKLVLHSCSYHSRYAIDNVPTVTVGAYKVQL